MRLLLLAVGLLGCGVACFIFYRSTREGRSLGFPTYNLIASLIFGTSIAAMSFYPGDATTDGAILGLSLKVVGAMFRRTRRAAHR